MWEVETTELFDEWFAEQSEALQDEVLAALKILSELGPHLGRPQVDTVKGSKFANMKELRVQFAGNPIRAFLRLTQRKALVLCAGDKTGLNEKRFYKNMIKLADAEFSKHLAK